MSKRYEHILSYDPFNFQKQGTRPRQEDSFGTLNAGDVKLIKEQGLLAVVADGIGGLRDGKGASSLTLDILRTDFTQYDRSRHLGVQLAESIMRAGQKVFQTYHTESGSTVVAAILYDEKLYFASVGDSTIWLVRNQEVIRLNEPHNMRFRIYRHTISCGSADPFEGRNNSEEHKLTEYIGSEEVHAIDMNYRPLLLQDGDVLILCSDGVGDVLTDEEVLYCLKGRNSQQACAMMDSMIENKQRQHQDNYTAIIIRCVI